MTTNNKISHLVSSQVPFFVRNDHPKFVAFLEAYYKYTEQNNKVVERAKNLQNYSNIDASSDKFKKFLYAEYLKQIPPTSKVDRDLILKNIKDLYRARGTEKATKFMLNIMFGIDPKNVSFYYPKRDILRASDGKWYVKKTLKIRDYFIDGQANTDPSALNFFINRQIRGAKSNATAIVETVETHYEKGFLVSELEVSNQKRNFAFNESVSTTFIDPLTGVKRTISANMYSGFISQVKLLSGGSGYIEGTIVPIESSTGTGGIIRIDQVTQGGINAVILNTAAFASGGAGFRVGDYIAISSRNPPDVNPGAGANARILSVVADDKYHPSSYDIPISIIADSQNTIIGNTAYTELNNANANTTLANATAYFTYANTGTFAGAEVLIPGARYIVPPDADILANTRIQALGILGRMEIIDGGLNYAVNDAISFINVDGGMGTGAAAKVNTVAANGMITEVKFVEVPGHTIGGSGYSQRFLPTANVISATGTGANVIVTAVLGDGESIRTTTETIGRILKLVIDNAGAGYETPPFINLKSSGSGTAQATSNIITGVYYYAGRYVNDDGHLSSYNFLEDREYYQQFSYVVRSTESLNKYEQTLKNILHPAGIKMFGEYVKENDRNFIGGRESITTDANNSTEVYRYRAGDYWAANSSNVKLIVPSHGLTKNDTVMIEFTTGNLDINDVEYYTVKGVSNVNMFFIEYSSNVIADGVVLQYYTV